MALTKRERLVIRRLKRLGGRLVPVKQVSKDLPKITIYGKGFKPITKMVPGNVGVPAREIILARRKKIKNK